MTSPNLTPFFKHGTCLLSYSKIETWMEQLLRFIDIFGLHMTYHIHTGFTYMTVEYNIEFFFHISEMQIINVLYLQWFNISSSNMPHCYNKYQISKPIQYMSQLFSNAVPFVFSILFSLHSAFPLVTLSNISPSKSFNLYT